MIYDYSNLNYIANLGLTQIVRDNKTMNIHTFIYNEPHKESYTYQRIISSIKVQLKSLFLVYFSLPPLSLLHLFYTADIQTVSLVLCGYYNTHSSPYGLPHKLLVFRTFMYHTHLPIGKQGSLIL